MVLTASCARDPRLLRARVVDAATEPGSHRWAIAVVEPSRHTTDTTHVSVWVGDGAEGPIERRGRVPVPEHLRRHFAARLLGWGGWVPVLELSGYAAPGTSPSARRLRWLALPEGEPPVLLSQLPGDLVHENGEPRGKRRFHWLSVEYGDSIRVRTEGEREARLVAVLDVVNGRVMGAMRSPDSPVTPTSSIPSGL